jgi:DNA topoisomerase-1
MDSYILRKIKSKRGNKYKYEYYDERNKKISSEKAKKYLKKIYIPPAYDNVKINKKKSNILAIGIDNKGRKQYTYDKKSTEKNSNNKFKKLAKFGKDYKKIIKKIDLDFYTGLDNKDKQIAIILKIIMDCNFRIGNDKYVKDNNSYGVSTLENQHIKVKRDKIIIDFIGKKGVRNECEIKNKKIIKTLKKKKKLTNKKERIFTYRKDNKYYDIKSNDVNNYLKKLGNYTTKNFRTWGANINLINELIKKNNNKKHLQISIDEVAKKLHHTSAICKKNYLDSKLIKFYEDDPEKFIKYFKNGDIVNLYTKFLENNY